MLVYCFQLFKSFRVSKQVLSRTDVTDLEIIGNDYEVHNRLLRMDRISHGNKSRRKNQTHNRRLREENNARSTICNSSLVVNSPVDTRFPVFHRNEPIFPFLHSPYEPPQLSQGTLQPQLVTLPLNRIHQTLKTKVTDSAFKQASIKR